MGLFSSKTIINVSSVSYNIYGDVSGRAQFLKEKLLYFKAAQLPLAPHLSKAYRESTGIKYRRAYRYAASLPQGVPSASIDLFSNSGLTSAAQDVMDDEHGVGTYGVVDASFVVGDLTSFVEEHLKEKYGWNPFTNEMSNPPTDINPGFSSTTDVRWAEYRRVPPGLLVNGHYDVATIEFRINPISPLPDYSYEHIRDITRRDESVALLVRAENTETNEIESFNFNIGTGEWPTLDSYYGTRNTWAEATSFFPCIPLRVDKLDLLREAVRDTPSFKQKVKLGKHLGIDIRKLAAQINENDSIKDIDHAFLIIGCNMGSTSKAEIDYLFHFWFRCWEYQVRTKGEYENWRQLPAGSRSKPNMNTLRIKDPEDGEKAYDITIEWNYINRVQTNGKFLVDGKEAKKGDVRIIKGPLSTELYLARGNQFRVESSTITIQKQVTDLYFISLEINGAMHKNHVYSGKTVETTAWEAIDDPEENSGFIVPLYMPIFNQMGLVRRTQLSQETAYVVFNSYQIVKKKWYQRGAFKIVLAIVLIVITIITWGGASGAAAGIWGAVATAVGGGVIGAIAVALMKYAVGYLVAMLIGKMQGMFVSMLGEKLGRIFTAVVTIVVSIYASGGNLSSAFNSGSVLVNAVNILNATDQVFSAYSQGMMVDRQKDQLEFLDTIKEEMKELKALEAGIFGEGIGMSIEGLLAINEVLRNESPEIFLTRTLMSSSDIIEMTYGMVSDMVDIEVHNRLPG